jgi:hypothetical protein
MGVFAHMIPGICNSNCWWIDKKPRTGQNERTSRMTGIAKSILLHNFGV